MNRSLLLLLLMPSAACHSFAEPAPPAWGGSARPPAPEPSASGPGSVQFDQRVELGSTLTLDDALRLAEQAAPELRAGADSVRAAEARLDAAGRLPDPALSVGVEAVPFSSPRDGDELLVGLAQEIPLGGTGEAARGVAEARRELARLYREEVRLQLETRVRGVYARALAAQVAVEQLTLRKEIGERLLASAVARVEQGDLLPNAVRMLRAELAVQSREAQGASALQAASKRSLAGLIGAADGAVGHLEGELAAVLGLAGLESLLENPATWPAVAGARAEAELARWRAVLAEARKLPSVELGLAYRRRGDGRDSFDAGLVLGLPIQGSRSAEARATRFEESAARQRAAAIERDSTAALRLASAETRNALAWLELYELELLPAAEAQQALAEARFDAGDLARPELLVVQDELAQLRLDRLSAYGDLLAAWSRLRGLLVSSDG